MFAPLELLGLILRAKRDVMDRARGDMAHTRVGQAKKIDHSARGSVIGGYETKTVSEIVDQAKAERVGQQACGSFVAFQVGGDAVKSAQRVLWRNRTARPRLNRRERTGGD